MHYVDLVFRGYARVIATAVLEGRDGLTLVDPGPTSCLPLLESGLTATGFGLSDVRRLLLTHIHLDHAGAAGTLVERLPDLEVVVHERGAPHLVDPAKLLASATRLYGDQMDALWGAVLPVPADRVHAVSGGETLRVADRAVRVAYTPGHASHHVAYLDESEGTAYVGDTAGISVSHGFLIAPTPPPDIDLGAWEGSLRQIESWQATRLFITHFGPITPPAVHLARFRETLHGSANAVARTLEHHGSDDERIRLFVGRLRAEARQAMPEEEAAAAELAAPFDQLWQGLARYWRKTAAGPTGG